MGHLDRTYQAEGDDGSNRNGACNCARDCGAAGVSPKPTIVAGVADASEGKPSGKRTRH
jgi:hypothetical protein